MQRQSPPYLWPLEVRATREYSRESVVETTPYVLRPLVPRETPERPPNPVRHVEVGTDHAGQRLDKFLRSNLPGVPHSRLQRLVRRGEVRVNGKRARPDLRLQVADDVRLPPVRTDAPGAPRRVPRPLIDVIEGAIIHEEPRLLVIAKPAGVAVHGGSGRAFGVIEALRASRPAETLELVHRLDRDTSGCLLVARKPAALRALHALLREGQIEKRYLTLVAGRWGLGHKRIDIPLRTDTRVRGERTVMAHASGKEALSEFRPVQFLGKRATLLEVAIHTGRTHQIRVHAAHAGHPVAGDEKYGDLAFNAQMRSLGLTRMFLHAHSISFAWPSSGEPFSASAPLPDELRALIDALEAAQPGRRQGTR
jgi:23S rRNA pseudouridine955/2504/2580 synthase